MFGHPYQELQNYFRKHRKGSLLDLGCGQGRDALFLASIGYKVTAIDNSHIGVAQMMKKAQAQGITVDCMVADVLELNLEKTFDVILCDMLLHSFAKEEQLDILKKCSTYLIEKGIMCIVFPDDMKTSHFMDLLTSLPYDWKLLEEITVNDVPKDEHGNADYTFMMIVVELVSRQ